MKGENDKMAKLSWEADKAIVYKDLAMCDNVPIEIEY